jgi:hypothetical protein
VVIRAIARSSRGARCNIATPPALGLQPFQSRHTLLGNGGPIYRPAGWDARPVHRLGTEAARDLQLSRSKLLGQCLSGIQRLFEHGQRHDLRLCRTLRFSGRKRHQRWQECGQRSRLANPGAQCRQHRLRTGADRDGRKLRRRRDSHGAEVLDRLQGRGTGQSRGHGDDRVATGKLGPRAAVSGGLPYRRVEVASGEHPRANTMRRSPAAITRCSMWIFALQ